MQPSMAIYALRYSYLSCLSGLFIAQNRLCLNSYKFNQNAGAEQVVSEALVGKRNALLR
jgi:hypothetical protein